MKSKTYTQSKRPLDKNERSEFCQSSVKQTHFQNLKKKRKWFFCSQGHFKCGLCDMDYVGDTNWCLHDHVNQHIVEYCTLNLLNRKHIFNMHRISRPVLINKSLVLKKCRNKFDWLMHKMLVKISSQLWTCKLTLSECNYLRNVCIKVQSNLSNTDTEGIEQSVYIREVSVLEKSVWWRHFQVSPEHLEYLVTKIRPKSVMFWYWYCWMMKCQCLFNLRQEMILQISNTSFLECS